MIEGQGLEAEAVSGAAADELLPPDRALEAPEVGRAVEIGQHDDPPDARDLALELRHRAEAVEVAPAVAVAVHAEEHLRLDLGKAVDDAARPEIGRAAGPDRPHAGTREERRD